MVAVGGHAVVAVPSPRKLGEPVGKVAKGDAARNGNQTEAEKESKGTGQSAAEHSLGERHEGSRASRAEDCWLWPMARGISPLA